MTRTRPLFVLLAFGLLGCAVSGCAIVDASLYQALPLDGGSDGGRIDASDGDGGPLDAGSVDGGTADEGPADGGPTCALGNGGCDPLVSCTDSGSGPVCGACPTGYSGDGAAGCTDIDECAAGTDGCDALVTCTNTTGAFVCGTCPLGYSGDGVVGCTDIDECATGTDACDPLVTCTNTPGGYMCGSCPMGFMGGGAGGCVDIDECATASGGCDPLTVCTNTAGSRTCSACPAGYSGDGATGCVDIDECAMGTRCGPARGTMCMNTAGSYTCVCPMGYDAPPTGGMCADIDECASGACDTAPAATCTNTAGSFTCACPADYAGTGVGASGCLYDNPSLASLTFGTGAMLSPAFSPGTTTYVLTLPPGAASGVWTATVALPASAAITVGGSSVTSGAGTSLTFGFAPLPIDVVVTTESGASRTYTIAVARSAVYVKASNTGSYWGFGSSVALSADGTHLAVGAPGEPSNSTGINGNQANASAGGSGAVYVFVRSGATWVQEAYVKASNTATNDLFGNSVSLSSDGARLAVGARLEDSSATGINGDQSNNTAVDSGAVYVFARVGSTWSQEAYVKASNTDVNDEFGGHLALSGDGTRLVVGARREDSNATGIEGAQADNSAADSGAAYVFSRVGSTWSQEAYVKASNTGAGDDFGVLVALSSDGTRLAVSARYEDSNAVGIGGDEANNSGPDSGAAYVFSRVGATWTQEAYVKASNAWTTDVFGNSLALSADGARLAIGATEEDSPATGVGGMQGDTGPSAESGAAYVFSRSGTVWAQEAYFKASNTGFRDQFGWSVSLSADGTRLAVSARSESSRATGINGDQTDDSATAAGAVYVFLRAGTAWAQEAYVKASNTEATDSFFTSIVLSGDGSQLAVGAPGEASNATGIGGNQANNSSTQAGATYVY